MISLERAHNLIACDAGTGLLFRRNGKRQGERACATRLSNGYLIGSVGGHRLMAHRLIWFMVHGYWPTLIDHINRNRADNRLSNLREATPSENALNSAFMEGRTPNQSSQFRGVRWQRAPSSRWLVQITHQGTMRYVGLFKDEEEAARAYDAAARLLGRPEQTLNFPRSTTKARTDCVEDTVERKPGE